MSFPFGLFLPPNEIAHAQSPTCIVYWKDPISGNWNDGSKWSTGTVPTSSDNICISVDGIYTVTLTGNRWAQNLTIGEPGNTGVQTLHIGSGVSFTLAGHVNVSAE